MNLQKFKVSHNSESPHFLLVGNPVGHSLSPLMHNTASEHFGMEEEYHAIQLEPTELADFASYLNREELHGVNITIPYKELLMDYVDELTPAAQDVGAINTIRKMDGRLVGCNTDVYGFLKPIEEYEFELEDTRALVFGTGGASKAIVKALESISIAEIVLVSRNPNPRSFAVSENNIQVCSYDAWPEYIEDTSLVVNATPLGMSPDIHTSPVSDHQSEILAGKICYDIVYRPQQTKFLGQAKKAGARTIGGLEMLIHQGSRSFELWTGQPFPVDLIRNTLKDFLKDEN